MADMVSSGMKLGQLLWELSTFFLKPKLVLQADQLYCRQAVCDKKDGSPITILRLYVKNVGFRTAEVRAWIEKVEVNGKVFDAERSPLNAWMDSDADHEKLGHDRHHYINLCQVQADNPDTLFIRSVRGGVGYNIRSKGLCRFTVSVSAEGLNSSCQVSVEVHHDGTLDGLNFVSIGERKTQLCFGDVRVGSFFSKKKS